MRLFKSQLLLFKRGTCGTDKASHYVIAGWHWNWSITWRWVIWWWPPKHFKLTKLLGTFLLLKQENMLPTIF